MEKSNKIIPVELSEGNTIYIEVSPRGNVSQDISNKNFSFDNIESTIKDLCLKFGNAIEKVKPDKAKIEFGLELAAESGKLTSILVKGEGKGSLKITLEWENKNQNGQTDSKVI